MNTLFVISILIVGFFGLSVGSFLNVVIYRLPRNVSIVFPASHCIVCGTPIKYRDNIPIVGYILLHGRCRECSSSISIIYPLVEFFTGCMFIALYILHGGLTLNFIADVILGAILIVASVIDARYMIIPDRLTYPGFLIAVTLSLRWGWSGVFRGIQGVMAGLVILLIMYVMGRLIYRRESVGMGDFKLVFVIGFFVGPLWCFISLAFAIIFGGIWGIFQLFSGKKRMGEEVPFGPFIGVGGFFVLFFKFQILFFIDRYLSMF